MPENAPSSANLEKDNNPEAKNTFSDADTRSKEINTVKDGANNFETSLGKEFDFQQLRKMITKNWEDGISAQLSGNEKEVSDQKKEMIRRISDQLNLDLNPAKWDVLFGELNDTNLKHEDDGSLIRLSHHELGMMYGRTKSITEIYIDTDLNTEIHHVDYSYGSATTTEEEARKTERVSALNTSPKVFGVDPKFLKEIDLANSVIKY